MADYSNTLSYPGQVNILRADLIAHNGGTFDITTLVKDITLYEDIFANTMSGYLLVEDAIDLIGTMPLVGQEILLLELQTPALIDKITKRFYIYKLSSLTTSKPRAASYILNFCSTELISSINSKVTKAFDGLISDSVIDIFKNDRYCASSEILNVDKTSNSLNFIAPYWTPLQTINWLTEKSINAKGVSNYLFYESNKSFEYTSVDTLFGKKKVTDYVFSDVNSRTVAPDDFNIQYMMVENMDTNVTFDYVRNTSAGMYGSTLYTYDITTKSIGKTTYDYFNDFDKATHLEQYPLQAPDLARKKIASIHHITKNNFRTGSNKPLKYSEFFLQRNSLIEQLGAFKFNIKVFGRTDIKVGDVINFTINKKRQIVASEIEPATAKSDYFSGKYLISAIRHQIIDGNHTMNMEIISDSFTKKLS